MIDKHIFVDFETRSLVDLTKSGAWKYAAHYSSYPLMLAAYYPKSGRKLQWLEYDHGRDCPSWVEKIAKDESITLHAFNANFEIAIWQRILVERWGWPSIPRWRWRDTAALSAHANCPRSLDNVGSFLSIRNKKDTIGKSLIGLLSMPQRAVKTTKTEDGKTRIDSFKYLESKGVELFEIDDTLGPVHFWCDDRGYLNKFAAYNEKDVIAEHEVDSLLPEYTGDEEKVWVLDSVINERGIPIDVELCEAVKELFISVYSSCESAIENLTNGQIKKPTQNAKVSKWVNQRINFGTSLSKEKVESWIEENPNPSTEAERQVLEMFEIRQVYGGSAVKKYQAALDVVEDDERARGQLLYYGASTGRWAGRGIQPHNFFRQAIPDEEVFKLIKSADYDKVKDFADQQGTSVSSLIRSCVRGLIRAPKGSVLVVSDFAGIESRVLQWLAGNGEALQLFRDGADMYVHTAARMYGLDYDSMMDPDTGKVKKEFKEHRQIGKAAVLGLGYQMGASKFLTELQRAGIEADETLASDIVRKWRRANPLVADFERGLWRRVERACKAAIKSKDNCSKFTASVRTGDNGVCLRFRYEQNKALTIELPSGRKLYYPRAELYDGDFGQAIHYQDGGKYRGTKTVPMVDTYGGKLIENIVQAVARDLLVNSMFLADSLGLYIIGHVHDEIIVESKIEDKDETYELLDHCMTTVPTWAEGLPLAAETYISERYSK